MLPEREHLPSDDVHARCPEGYVGFNACPSGAGKSSQLLQLERDELLEPADADLLGGADATSTIAVFDLSVEGESAARDVVWFKPAKEIAWADPAVRADVRQEGDGYVLALTAQQVARAVWLDFGDLDAELSDNALTLLPGESITLRVSAKAGADELRKALSLRSLADVVPATVKQP